MCPFISKRSNYVLVFKTPIETFTQIVKEEQQELITDLQKYFFKRELEEIEQIRI